MDQIINQSPILKKVKSKKNPTGFAYKIERKYNKNGNMIINNSSYFSAISIDDNEFLPSLFD